VHVLVFINYFTAPLLSFVEIGLRKGVLSYERKFHHIYPSMVKA